MKRESRLDLEKVVTIKDDEKYLRQVSTPVDFNDTNLENDINNLKDFCKNNDVLAMASVQLRIPKRIIYLKNTNIEIVKKFQNDSMTDEESDYDEERILINPVIISRCGLTEYYEACASCLDNMGLVERPYEIVVEYYDINQKKHIDTFKGFESTVLSHEMDHLDGILHMDISKEIIVMKEEDRKVFRQTHDYNIISKDGDFETLKNKYN